MNLEKIIDSVINKTSQDKSPIKDVGEVMRVLNTSDFSAHLDTLFSELKEEVMNMAADGIVVNNEDTGDLIKDYLDKLPYIDKKGLFDKVLNSYNSVFKEQIS